MWCLAKLDNTFQDPWDLVSIMMNRNKLPSVDITNQRQTYTSKLQIHSRRHFWAAEQSLLPSQCNPWGVIQFGGEGTAD